MNKTFFSTGVVFGGLAVILGAFAAHTLEKYIGEGSIQTFQTGVRYQMYHALLLLIVAQTNFITAIGKKYIFTFLVTGIVLFSFSIYFLATNELTSFDFKNIAFITPLGGVCLILGWILLGIQAVKRFH